MFHKKLKKMKNFRIVLLLLLPTAMWACASPGEPPPDDHMGVIIVANKSGDNVHFVDRMSGEVILELPTGPEPHEVEVSDDGRYAVVCNYGDRQNPGHTLSVYDVASGSLIRTIDLGEHTRPHGMQWMPGTTNILVTAEGSRNLLVVDVDAALVLRAMYTGQDVSHMVAATPDMRRAFVPSIRTGNVTVFDLETGELLDQVFSGRGAEGIDVSPDGKEVWVTNRGDNTITIIDAETLEVLDRIACEDFPIRARFTPDGSLFLVSNARSGDVAVFDTESRELIRSIKLTPPTPEDLDQERYFFDFEGTSVPIGLVIPDNKKAYVANTRSDAISVIDLETLEIVRHFSVGKEPDGIAYSPVYPRVE